MEIRLDLNRSMGSHNMCSLSKTTMCQAKETLRCCYCSEIENFYCFSNFDVRRSHRFQKMPINCVPFS